MSGAHCTDGCTSCPTCRGEVQPDSPAMHDVDFAMSMEKRAFVDRQWSGVRVAQVIRSAIRARDGGSADDKRVLAFVDGIERARAATSSAPPWGVPLGLFDERPDSQPHAPPALPSAPKLLTEAELKRIPRKDFEDDPRRKTFHKLFGVDDTLEKIKTRRKKKGGASQDEKLVCCVKSFLYPSVYYKTWIGKKLGITFIVNAEYRDGGAPVAAGGEAGGTGGSTPEGVGKVVAVCSCPCCEFRQYVDTGDGNGFQRECYIYDPSTRTTERTVMHRTKLPEPKADEVIVCPGDKLNSPDLEAALKQAGMALGEYEKDGCKFRFVDHTGVTGLVQAGVYKYHVKFLGTIEDRCVPPEVRRIEKFTIDYEATEATMDPSKPWSAEASTLPKSPLVGLSEGNAGERAPQELAPIEEP